jgi:hypothetical protein
LPIHSSVCLSFYLSVCPPVHLFSHPFFYLPVVLFICQRACLSACSSVCLFTISLRFLSVELSMIKFMISMILFVISEAERSALNFLRDLNNYHYNWAQTRPRYLSIVCKTIFL